MPFSKAHRGWATLLLIPGLALATVLTPPASESYSLPRHSVDGGAGQASSASYVVRGTMGQAEAGATASSASFEVRGGFHRSVGSSDESSDPKSKDDSEEQGAR
ncbi:MAG TPA: hypothetical protein PKZ76_01215 [Xanthomonadaceae bacterium]|nr:hypothetical protein [Xanthomonadaceae bacterium]